MVSETREAKAVREEIEMVELQSNAGFKEKGTTGIDTWADIINEAYTDELKWPQVSKLYSDMWRSDPEITVMRNLLDAWSSALTIGVTLPGTSGGKEMEKPSDDDKKAHDFLWEVISDVEGGIGKWLTSIMTRVPFFGFGIWETPLCIRDPEWVPPDRDPWRSNYSDGLIGYRRLAFRRYNSMYGWDMDEKTGRLNGFMQLDLPNPVITIPVDKLLHCTFGDSDNPEGLATMEALWRLERIKYGLEFIQGIGFEHSAGHLSIEVEKGKFDEEKIKKAARAIMTAQEGNYAAWPEGIKGQIIDSGFSSAEALMDAIRYFSLLKLSLIGFQFIGIASISGTGSFAAMKDASKVAMTIFNAMAKGFVSQMDQQIGTRLFDYPINKAAFPGMTRRPEITVDRLEKELDLSDYALFLRAIKALLPLGDNDFIAIRKRSEILPASLPEDGKIMGDDEGETFGEGEMLDDEISSQKKKAKETETKIIEAVKRPFIPSPDEHPIDVGAEAIITEKDIRRATRKFNEWAKENDPDIHGILNAKVVNRPEDE